MLLQSQKTHSKATAYFAVRFREILTRHNYCRTACRLDGWNSKKCGVYLLKRTVSQLKDVMQGPRVAKLDIVTIEIVVVMRAVPTKAPRFENQTGFTTVM